MYHVWQPRCPNSVDATFENLLTNAQKCFFSMTGNCDESVIVEGLILTIKALSAQTIVQMNTELVFTCCLDR